MPRLAYICQEGCSIDTDCQEGEMCNQGECSKINGKCFKSNDCLPSQSCHRNYCADDCLGSSDCKTSQYCHIDIKICMEHCKSFQDCIGNYQCFSGECARECSSDLECFYGQYCDK